MRKVLGLLAVFTLAAVLLSSASAHQPGPSMMGGIMGPMMGGQMGLMGGMMWSMQPMMQQTMGTCIQMMPQMTKAMGRMAPEPTPPAQER